MENSVSVSNAFYGANRPNIIIFLAKSEYFETVTTFTYTWITLIIDSKIFQLESFIYRKFGWFSIMEHFNKKSKIVLKQKKLKTDIFLTQSNFQLTHNYNGKFWTYLMIFFKRCKHSWWTPKCLGTGSYRKNIIDVHPQLYSIMRWKWS